MMLHTTNACAELCDLEDELLSRFALYLCPIPLRELFEPYHIPEWAFDALTSLVQAGKLREVEGGWLEVVDREAAPILRAGPGVQLHAEHYRGEGAAVRRLASRPRAAA